MEIHFFTEDISMPDFDENVVTNWIDSVIKIHKRSTWKLNFIFCSDEHLLSINKQYLNHDYYTDVITFDYCENKRVSGDIFISVDMVKQNAIKYAINEHNELFRVIIHGVLHLCGFKDTTDTEQEEMTKQENAALAAIKF